MQVKQTLIPARNGQTALAPLVTIVSGAVLCLCLIGTATWAFDKQAEKAPVGLKGILPGEVPADLSADGFARLDGNWKKWSAEVAGLVEKFYTKTAADVAGQRKQLEELSGKLATMDQSLHDERYASLYVPLAVIHAQLSRRVDLAKAILDTLEADPQAARKAQLESAREKVQNDLKALDTFLTSMQNGKGWLSYVKAADIDKLLDSDKDAQGGMAVLRQVKQRLNSPQTNGINAVQRKFLNRPQFRAFSESLDNYLALADAAIVEKTPEQLRKTLAKLVSAVEAYEAEADSKTASAVRSAFAEARKAAPDGGEAIAIVMRTHYFNYNLNVLVSEKFLNRMASFRRRDEGPVDDYILGAKVDGQQTTNSTVGVDLRPSADSARFAITLEGTVNSNTAGVTSEAVVYTSGYHYFWAAKELNFDGAQFKIEPATISVNANNSTYDADTNYNRSLFSGMARRIAIRTAEGKRWESEAIAVERVEGQVLPKFNQEVNKNFNKANNTLKTKTIPKLKEKGLYPSAYQYQTTDDRLMVYTRLMSVGEMGANTPSDALADPEGLTVYVHESHMNNSVDRMNLAGRSLTEKQLNKEIEDLLSNLLGKPVNLQKDGKAPSDDLLIFSKTDPIRFAVKDGGIEITLQAGLKQPDKDEIPTQVITIPITIAMEKDEVVVSSGKPSISAVERPKSIAVQITRAGVIRKKIQDALPERHLKRAFDVEVDRGEGEKGKVALNVSDVQALDGWLIFSLR